MSLIRVRRKRKKQWIDHHKGRSPRLLMVLLALVILIVWYLETRF